jgi:hypothetical protein
MPPERPLVLEPLPELEPEPELDALRPLVPP